MSLVLGIQVGTFFLLGLLFLKQGNVAFGVAQLCFGAGTLSIYS